IKNISTFTSFLPHTSPQKNFPAINSEKATCQNHRSSRRLLVIRFVNGLYVLSINSSDSIKIRITTSTTPAINTVPQIVDMQSKIAAMLNIALKPYIKRTVCLWLIPNETNLWRKCELSGLEIGRFCTTRLTIATNVSMIGTARIKIGTINETKATFLKPSNDRTEII